MRRVIVFFVVLVAILSAGIYWKLREQRLEEARPSGGSATIEGTEVDIVARLPARVKTILVEEGEEVRAGQLLVELECDDQEALLRKAEAGVAAARAQLEAARVGAKLADQGVETAARQAAAAEAGVVANRAQARAVAAQAAAARRARARLEKVHAAGAASDQLLDRTATEATGLGQKTRALAAGVDASEAQAAMAEAGKTAAELQVALAATRIEAAAKGLEAAEATLARARVAVDECRLVAPRGGYVQSRNFEVGEAVLPGSRLLDMIDTRVVEATFYLPNAELAAAKPGQGVHVVADAYPDEQFEGTIRRVATSAEFTPRNVQTRADRDRLVYAVHVQIPNPEGRLRPGMPVEIRIPGTERR